MRIISGKARGLKLLSLEGPDTRPTLDNVKEAIFSMLFYECPDAAVLDLFAGSGALGIEALSRGAKEACFVDSNPKACSIVKANLEKSRLGDAAVVINTDYRTYLRKAADENKKFDLIFLDPPYALGLLDEVLALILEYELLNSGALIVCEFENGTDIDIKNYKLVKDKRYGRACVMVLESLS